MIVEKIEHYLTGRGQTLDEEVLQQMWNSFTFSVQRQLMEERELSKNLRGSNPGPCARKMAYATLGYEPTEPLQARSKVTFLTGDLLELVAVGMMRLAGLNVTDTCLDADGQSEAIFDVGNGTLVKCHADGILHPQIGVTDVKRLLEIKSSSDYGFKREWLRGNMSDQYRLQHNIYMEAYGIDHGIFLVVNKNTGHFAEVLTEKDPDIIEWGRKNYLLASVADEDNIPPRFMDFENYGLKKDKQGNVTNQLCWGCSYCDFTRYCWPGVELEINSRGKPEYYVPQELVDTDDYVIRFGEKEGEISLTFELEF